MKKLPAQKQIFQKFRPYELGHIKIELINQDKWYGHSCTIKYLERILLIPLLIATTGTYYMTNKASNNKQDWNLVKYLNDLHKIEHKSSYSTKIFYYTCKTFFINF